jgi:hypothetical protein
VVTIELESTDMDGKKEPVMSAIAAVLAYGTFLQSSAVLWGTQKNNHNNDCSVFSRAFPK